MGTDTGVQAHAVDDLAGVEALGLGVGVQLVEIAHAQRQVGVGEELDRLCLGEAHEEGGDVLLDGALLQQLRELSGGVLGALVAADDDTAGVEVVVEGFALAQELGAEDDFVAAVLGADGLRVAHGNSGLDDHRGAGVDAHHQLDDLLHVGAVEVVCLGVVVGGRGDDYEFGVAVRSCAVQSCG